VIKGVVVPAAAGAALIVTCAEELKDGEVELQVGEDWPVALAYTAWTVTIPGDLPVSTPPPIVAREPLDTVHCVLDVTSCVEPSLRCAVAFKAAAPPTLMVDGVATAVKEFKV
jgi:hypothetical protein